MIKNNKLINKILNKIKENKKFVNKFYNDKTFIKKALKNKNQINFMFLDPYNQKNKNANKNLETEIDPAEIMEYVITELSNKFSGKKTYFKILTPGHYIWALNSPYDDIIIAYSFKSKFDINEAGILFSKRQKTL